MKKYLVFITLIYILNVNPTLAASLTVTINNIEPNNGLIHIGLFTEADAFPIVTADLNMIIIPSEKTAITQVFENLDLDDKYAIAIFQDSNNSKALEKNIFGAPKEPYGFSQKMPTFRAPTFDEAAITLTEPVTNIRITLR